MKDKITLKDMEEEIKRLHKESPETFISLKRWKEMCKKHDKNMKECKRKEIKLGKGYERFEE